MKEMIETIGVFITELVGFAAVAFGLYGAIILLRAFGDKFIGYFL